MGQQNCESYQVATTICGVAVVTGLRLSNDRAHDSVSLLFWWKFGLGPWHRSSRHVTYRIMFVQFKHVHLPKTFLVGLWNLNFRLSMLTVGIAIDLKLIAIGCCSLSRQNYSCITVLQQSSYFLYFSFTLRVCNNLTSSVSV